MEYNYKPRVREFIIKHGKNISIIILVIAILIVFIGVNSFMTGFIAYNNELEKNLSNYESKLNVASQSLDTCTNEIKAIQTDLQNCEK
jgi:conjugal transfer/entry exclusion protein